MCTCGAEFTSPVKGTYFSVFYHLLSTSKQKKKKKKSKLDIPGTSKLLTTLSSAQAPSELSDKRRRVWWAVILITSTQNRSISVLLQTDLLTKVVGGRMRKTAGRDQNQRYNLMLKSPPSLSCLPNCVTERQFTLKHRAFCRAGITLKTNWNQLTNALSKLFTQSSSCYVTGICTVHMATKLSAIINNINKYNIIINNIINAHV